MQAAFLPYNYERELYQRFQQLRQGQKSVDEYTHEFYQLLSRTALIEMPVQLVSRFVGGLRLPLQEILNMFDSLTVSEAHQRAIQAEKQLARCAATSSRPVIPPASTAVPQQQPPTRIPGQPPANATLFAAIIVVNRDTEWQIVATLRIAHLLL